MFGLGCAGGVSGLALAARLAKASPGSKVLFVTIELCTLAFRLDELTKANIVATALFGDGAAACVLSTDGEAAWRVEGAGYDVARFPRFRAHARAMEARPAVQRAIAREEAAHAQLEAEGLAFVPPKVG